MATLGPFFSGFMVSLLLLIIHLGCFTLSAKHRPPKPKIKRKPPHNPAVHLNKKALLPSCWSSLKHLVALKSRHHNVHHNTRPESAPASARSSQNSTSPFINPHESARSESLRDGPSNRPEFIPESSSDTTVVAHDPIFPLRNGISPCSICGEIFQNLHLLQHHQWAEHPVSELRESESGNNVIRIIFTSGWSSGQHNSPTIHRILRIHNSPKVLARFEEHREAVKLKAAARNGAVGRRRHLDERCMADGNELLRFHCSTFLCDLGGQDQGGGGSSVCSHAFCSTCGIIRGGFSPKMDGIATLSSSWGAHAAIPEEMEEEFAFMNVKRAMLVCRVVAGRTGCWGNRVRGGSGDADKDDGGFDSMLGSRSHNGADIGGVVDGDEEEEELLLFNPRAVLPCFVIVYSA